MLNRSDIHNGAILKPQLSKCAHVLKTGRHAFAPLPNGGRQCVECGTIRPDKDTKNGLHRRNIIS